jgi:uncharacterized protein YciW
MSVNLIEQMVGAAPGSPVAEALAARAALMQASQDNYAAVLTPHDPGGLSPELRFALAARIARLSGDDRLAAYYAEASGGEPAVDARMTAILRHVDLVTLTPRDATPDDILTLRNAGVSTADIVRLSQVIAFVSYPVRDIAGLRLMGAAA